MADKKISGLTAADALTGAELVELVQGGVNKRTTTQDIADLGGGGGAVDSVNGQTGIVVLDAADVGADPAGSAAAAQAAAIASAAASLAAKVIYDKIQITDEVTNIAASTTIPKRTFYLEVNRTIDSLMFSLTTAQASGSIFTIDIHIDGTTVLSTKATIDNTENTSLTAATPYVLTDNTWNQGQKVEVFVDQIGNGSAVELIMYIGWH